jgi:hypothetical protein
MNRLKGKDLRSHFTKGFPKLISAIKASNSAEMVLEVRYLLFLTNIYQALGPNLRHLEEASPKKHFSKPSVFLICIYLVNSSNLTMCSWRELETYML